MQRLLTITEAAELLSCSTATVIRHITAGRLLAINLANGKRRSDYRIAPDALQAFLEGRTVEKPKYSCASRRKVATGKDHFPNI